MMEFENRFTMFLMTFLLCKVEAQYGFMDGFMSGFDRSMSRFQQNMANTMGNLQRNLQNMQQRISESNRRFQKKLNNDMGNLQINLNNMQRRLAEENQRRTRMLEPYTRDLKPGEGRWVNDEKIKGYVYRGLDGSLSYSLTSGAPVSSYVHVSGPGVIITRVF